MAAAGVPQRAGDAHQISRLRSVAPHGSCSDLAHPTTVTLANSIGGGDVPSRDRGGGGERELLPAPPPISASPPCSPTRDGIPSATYASPACAPIAARSDSPPASARQPTSVRSVRARRDGSGGERPRSRCPPRRRSAAPAPAPPRRRLRFPAAPARRGSARPPAARCSAAATRLPRQRGGDRLDQRQLQDLSPRPTPRCDQRWR